MRTAENYSNISGDLTKIKIKEIVTQNFHAAQLFEKYGIDYCCNGNRPLFEVLEEKKLSPEKILTQLNELKQTTSDDSNPYGEWELDFLAQYIVNTHHRYVKNAIPQIADHINKIVNAHGKKYSYLLEMHEVFAFIAEDLTQHMMKEEKILFPLIKYLVETKKFNEKPKTGGYGTIKGPINKMEQEHAAAGNATAKIRELSNGFSLPPDACATFRVTYQELEEFEKDLHKHVHLENNILFPRAIELEEELLKL